MLINIITFKRVKGTKEGYTYGLFENGLVKKTYPKNNVKRQ